MITFPHSFHSMPHITLLCPIFFKEHNIPIVHTLLCTDYTQKQKTYVQYSSENDNIPILLHTLLRMDRNRKCNILFNGAQLIPQHALHYITMSNILQKRTIFQYCLHCSIWIESESPIFCSIEHNIPITTIQYQRLLMISGECRILKSAFQFLQHNVSLIINFMPATISIEIEPYWDAHRSGL